MKLKEAYAALLAAPDGKLKYQGSGFKDGMRSKLCRAAIINMKDGYMVLTNWGRIVAEKETSGSD